MTTEEYRPTQDQVDRKARSETLLRAAGVRINDWLPVRARVEDMQMPSAREVADRLLALAIVAVKGEGLEQNVIEKIVEERDVRRRLTPLEATFIDDPSPTQHDLTQFVWRYEAALALMWALRLTEKPLGLPTDICDVPFLVETVRDTPDLAHRGVRSLDEIADEADLIFRCHWATRQSSLDGKPPGGGLDNSVAMERHHALNWLTGECDGCGWDDVTTDT